MKFILFGPPGAGKGTVSYRITKKLEVPHISSGAMLREIARTGESKQALDIRHKLAAGELIDDNTVMQLMRQRLVEKDCELGFLLDGYPRTVIQAKDLPKYTAINIVINLQAADEVVKERLLHRRTCGHCGATFHLKYIPPKMSGICDHCGGTLMQRDDDKVGALTQRLDSYHAVTQPLIEYYANQGLLSNISAEDSADNVYDKVYKLVTSYQFAI